MKLHTVILTIGDKSWEVQSTEPTLTIKHSENYKFATRGGNPSKIYSPVEISTLNKQCINDIIIETTGVCFNCTIEIIDASRYIFNKFHLKSCITTSENPLVITPKSIGFEY